MFMIFLIFQKNIHHLKFDEKEKNDINISAKAVGYQQEEHKNCIQKHNQQILNKDEQPVQEQNNEEDEDEEQEQGRERRQSIPHLDFDKQEINDDIKFVGKRTNSPRMRSMSRASNSSLQEIQETKEEGLQIKGHRINTSRSQSRSRSRFSTSPRNKTNGEQELESKLNKIEEEIQIMQKDSPKSYKREKSDIPQGIQEDDEYSEPEPIEEKDEELFEDKPRVGEHRNNQLGINLKKFEDQTNKIEADELSKQENRKRVNSQYNSTDFPQEQTIQEEDEKSSNLENL
ncbi:hypothetical protein PPERSA_13080 [Pseudocohnilembus persalinus]|uniref:Uncharacterized protein n=1 Tax=Pseudocohnilembus persalinus TaxID=266149 RepID=A0A0V0QW35_PSEPJ|nr:hypothetical protein PPERSA_13080 [Pseudocohnilembus persalinus]|eukprot:KRX06601.1 hypothetical protein PPERSA_13080 [Pseudocohnilembus persalinus]